MGITLIINPGSSSKKFALYKDEEKLLDAYIENGDKGFSFCTIVKGVQQICNPISQQRFCDSLSIFLKQAQELRCIDSLFDIKKVAMRTVAPGTYFQKHRELNTEYWQKLKMVESVAPLHIPHILKEIDVVKKELPQAKLVAVSDSAFHSTIPDYIRDYSITPDDAEKYDLYRFGYHGISVSSVIGRINSIVGADYKKTIICHIGSGVSVTAVKDGKSFDNSMGYSPVGGLIMSSRAGDLDVGALLTLMQGKNFKPIDAQGYVQNSGGLRGLANEKDLRLLLERKIKGDITATKAIKSFVYQIQKTIGGYVAGMDGLDLLVFTATAGERSYILRELITNELGGLGIKIDSEKNESLISKNGIISVADSQVKVAVIKTDENGEMLRVVNNF